MDGGVNDTGHRGGGTRAFHLSLGKAARLDQIRDSPHKFTDPQGDPVEIRHALEKHRSGEHAAK